MKEKFVNALGGVGVILYYLVSLLVGIMPAVMIDAPFLLTALFFFIMEIFPISTVVFWIWGLISAIKGPQDFLAIAYYILFAIAFLPIFINAVLTLFSKKN